jgi:hypothetical protein
MDGRLERRTVASRAPRAERLEAVAVSADDLPVTLRHALRRGAHLPVEAFR